MTLLLFGLAPTLNIRILLNGLQFLPQTYLGRSISSLHTSIHIQATLLCSVIVWANLIEICVFQDKCTRGTNCTCLTSVDVDKCTKMNAEQNSKMSIIMYRPRHELVCKLKNTTKGYHSIHPLLHLSKFVHRCGPSSIPGLGRGRMCEKVSSVTCRRSVVSSGCSGFLHQKTDFIIISPP